MNFKNAMQETQKSILQYAKQGRPYEVLSAVLAARQYNTTIIETDMQQQVNDARQFKVSYMKLQKDGVVSRPNEVFFELKEVTKSAQYQLNRDDIRYHDGSYMFGDHAKAAINAALPSVRRKLAIQVANKLVHNIGCFYDGGDKRILPFLDKESNNINPKGLFEIERIYRDAGLTSPFIVGGADVFHWRKAVEVAGNDNSGKDVSQQGRSNAYYDTLINDAIYDALDESEGEHVIGFDPQLLKFMSFNRNAGIFATDLQNIDAIDAVYNHASHDSIDGVMADPLTGLLWDLNLKYDKTSYRWTFQWKLEWDMFVVPPHSDGVSGVLHFISAPES